MTPKPHVDAHVSDTSVDSSHMSKLFIFLHFVHVSMGQTRIKQKQIHWKSRPFNFFTETLIQRNSVNVLPTHERFMDDMFELISAAVFVRVNTV